MITIKIKKPISIAAVFTIISSLDRHCKTLQECLCTFFKTSLIFGEESNNPFQHSITLYLSTLFPMVFEKLLEVGPVWFQVLIIQFNRIGCFLVFIQAPDVCTHDSEFNPNVIYIWSILESTPTFSFVALANTEILQFLHC